MSERPPDSAWAQAGNDFRIFVNVGIVVVIYKLVAQRLAIDNPDHRHQSIADGNGDRRFTTGRRW